MELDLGAVRAFLAVVDDGHFTVAADRLGLTQQAASKRIARLEADLETTLLTRSRTGAKLTADGAAFLPQDLARAFYETAGVDVEVVVSRGVLDRQAALADGSLDAAFARVTGPAAKGLARIPASLEPLPVLLGRGHPLASRPHVRMAELAGLTAWMPGNARDSEWAQYYRFLSADFGVAIDTSGPVFGAYHMMERIGGSAELIMFGSSRQFPVHPDVVQLPVTDPTPVYPWSLLWHEANRHPALPLLVEHVKAGYRPHDPASQWLPAPDRLLFPARW